MNFHRAKGPAFWQKLPHPVTRSEIQLVVFIVSALLIGAGVQWYRGREVRNLQIPAEASTPAPAKWARPPYVFKTAKEAREAHEKSVREQAVPR